MINIIKIAKQIEKKGGRLYLVGGALRDMLLEKPIKDQDYCIVGISLDDALELFPNAKIIGKTFGVISIGTQEFAMARDETKTGQGHKSFNIKTDKSITIEQDLKRRDITINSIAQDVLTGEIIDPFLGVQDLKNKIIRATSEKFIEDPLRVYRVARFASSLEFDVEQHTLKLMEKLKNELPTLSKERVFSEFQKALASNRPSIFFEVLRKTNTLDVHFKQIYKLIGAIQPEEYHPEGDSYNHTLLSLDKSVHYTNDLKIRYSVLVHDLGKGVTPKENYPHHYNHDKLGEQQVKNLSNCLGVPKSWEKSGIISATEHMKAGIFDILRPAKKVILIEKLSKSELGIDGMEIVVKCDRCRKLDCEDETVNIKQIAHNILTNINGKYIKEKYGTIQGKEFKEKLTQERINYLIKKRKESKNVKK